MRPSNKSRSRNKTGNNGGNHSGNSNNNNNNNNNGQRRSNMGNIINRVFESAGPDGKVRGTPQQIIDKYQALARDAQVSGDRVAAESYLQHSEHYSRLLGEAQRAQQEARATQERDNDRDEGGFEQRRQPQPNMASGLTMIDTDDVFDSGPIETPEGRRGYEDGNNGFQRRDREPRGNGNGNGQQAAPQHEPAPVADVPAAAEPAPQPVAVAQPAPVAAPEAPAPQAEAPAEPQVEFQLAEPEAEPVKKPRARRRKTQPAPVAEDAAPSQPESAASE